jgi:hypothetical protein
MKCQNGGVGSFLFISFSLLGIEFEVIPFLKVNQCLTEQIFNSGGYYLYLKIFLDTSKVNFSFNKNTQSHIWTHIKLTFPLTSHV